MAARALERLETLLTGIYDLDTGCRVEDFLVTDRQALPGECREAPGDEQLFVSAVYDELCMSLYLDWPCSNGSSAMTRATASTRRISPTAGPRSKASAISFVAHNAGTTGCRALLEMQAEIDGHVAARGCNGNPHFPGELHTPSSAARRYPTRAGGRRPRRRRPARPRDSVPGSNRGCAPCAGGRMAPGSRTSGGSTG